MKLKCKCPYCDKTLMVQGLAGHMSGKHPIEWYNFRHESEGNIARLADNRRAEIIKSKKGDTIDRIVNELMTRPPKKT
jgi:hypothetical protein